MRSILLLISVGLFSHSAISQSPELRFEGLRIWVTDLDTAKKFYSDILGFEFKLTSDNTAKLETGTWPILLAKSVRENTTEYKRHARTGLTLQVYKLLPKIDQLRASGVHLIEDQLQRNGVGISIPFRDPFGNLLSLMEVQVRDVPLFEGFKIYNTGITSGNMEEAMDFYIGKLGFLEWSRDYLPQALPLKHSDNSFAFMLHYKPDLSHHDREFTKDSEINLLFSTRDLNKAVANSKARKLKFIKEAADWAAFKDPFGNICELIEKK